MKRIGSSFSYSPLPRKVLQKILNLVLLSTKTLIDGPDHFGDLYEIYFQHMHPETCRRQSTDENAVDITTAYRHIYLIEVGNHWRGYFNIHTETVQNKVVGNVYRSRNR